MAIINKGKSFANGEQLTADKLNQVIDDATFTTSAVDNVSTQLSGGGIIVKDGGVTTAKIADSNVTTAKIADANVTFEKLTDVIDDDTMATASATTLATSESIKAYVDNSTSIPSYVKLTGGTIALNHTSDGTYTWNKSDFTGTGIDTDAITGLWVRCFGSSRFNGNFTQVNYTFPDGTVEPIFRTDSLNTPEDHVTSNTILTFVPVGTNQTQIVLTLSSSTSYGKEITLVGVQQFV
jgi:hypothetical protein